MIVNKKSLHNLKVIADLTLLNASFFIAAVLAQSLETLFEKNFLFILLLIQNFLWYFSSRTTRFYDEFGNRYFSYQIINLLKLVFLQLLAAILFIFIAKENLFTRNFILFYSFLLPVLVSIRFLLFKRMLKALRKKGKNVRDIVIIGAGEVGLNFYNMIINNPDMGYNLVGFVDDGAAVNEKIKVIGTTGELQSVFDKNRVEEVIIALPNYAYESIDRIIKICNHNAVGVHIIPDYFRFISKKFQISMIGSFPIISVRNEPLEEIQWRLIKRVFDLTVSITAIMLVTSWIFPLIIIIQKLTSKGPVFFIQKRVGRDNKEFNCFKFRTMHINPDTNKFKPTTKDDPRVTKFGRFLRKSNLDELPQIFNVLLGDMSIVGPRPHPLAYNSQYTEFIDDIKIRHTVKPGLTGWAQVHGLRGDVPDENENRRLIRKRIDHDIWYIENWTLWLDIQIILLTVWRMLRGDTKGY